MSTMRQFTASIKQRLYGEFNAAGLDPDTVVQWPNQSFKFPKETIFARVFVSFEDRLEAEVNSYLPRTTGSVQLSIYSPSRTSTEAHDDVVQSMLPSLDRYEGIPSSSFEPTRAITVGRLDAYWVTRLETVFTKYN